MFEEIRQLMQRLEDNEYSGENGHALRTHDINELLALIENIEEEIGKAVEVLQDL